MPDSRPDHGDGFTLIEVIVVIAILGIISAVLAATVVVIVRTTPTSESRLDDARALQGLVTWLPQDVDSTPPGGFDVSPTKATGCTGASPGTSLLHMRWTETVGGTTTVYVANYRHVTVAGESVVRRYTCSGTGGGPYTLARDIPVSSTLKSLPSGWAQGQLPARVTVTPNGLGDVALVEFDLVTVTGKLIQVDSAPRNPAQTLAPTTTTGGTTTTSTSTTSTSTSTTTPTTTTTTLPGATTTTSTSTTTTTSTSTTTTTTTVPCVVSSLTTNDPNNRVNLKSDAPALIDTDVIVTVTWSGGCQGLYLKYNSGGTGALLTQNFPTSPPYRVTLKGHPQGSELWTLGSHPLQVYDANGGPYGPTINFITVAKGQPA